MAIQATASDIHLRSSQALGLSSLSSFSVTTWLNSVWNPGSRRSFVGIYGPASDTPLATPITAVQIGSAAGNGDLTFWTWGGGALTSTATGVMTPFNNQWVFIAYTFDGTTHRGYLNGTLVTSSTNAQIPGFLNQVYINGYPGGGVAETGAFQVDGYRLFRRVLSEGEIASMRTGAGSRHGITQGVVAKYEFGGSPEGTTVTSITDVSGQGNTLTTIGPGTPMTYTYLSTVATSNIRPVQ